MKNLIYIEGENNYQFDSVNELYELIFSKNYFKLKKKKKLIKRYSIAFYKIKFNHLNLDIVHTKMGKLGDKYRIISTEFDIDKAIIIDDEKEFVKSLCQIPYISIIENKDFDGLISIEEKEKYLGNYIIINKEFLTNRKGN